MASISSETRGHKRHADDVEDAAKEEATPVPPKKFKATEPDGRAPIDNNKIEESAEKPNATEEQNGQAVAASSAASSTTSTDFFTRYAQHSKDRDPLADAAKRGEEGFLKDKPLEPTKSIFGDSGFGSSGFGTGTTGLFGKGSIFGFSSATTSGSSGPFSFSTANTTAEDKEEEEAEQEEEDLETKVNTDADNEDEAFTEWSVKILKCVPVVTKIGDEGKETTQLRFRGQGEGTLRVLVKRNEGQAPSASRDPQEVFDLGRLILRQKGTHRLLLNAPINSCLKFVTLPESTRGFGAKFVGLDFEKLEEAGQAAEKGDPNSTLTSASKAKLFSAYSLMFPFEHRRALFLNTIGCKYEDQPQTAAPKLDTESEKKAEGVKANDEKLEKGTTDTKADQSLETKASDEKDEKTSDRKAAAEDSEKGDHEKAGGREEGQNEDEKEGKEDAPAATQN